MTFEGTVTAGDLLAFIAGLAAILVALVALRISEGLARKSVQRPFVMEKLYELYQYAKSRRFDPQVPLDQDIERLVNELGMIRVAGPILDAAGFKSQVNDIASRAATFSTIREELITPGFVIGPADAERLLAAAKSLDRAIQDLLGALEPQMEQALRNPLGDLRK